MKKRHAFEWMDHKLSKREEKAMHEPRVTMRPTGEQYHDMMMAHLPIVEVAPRDTRQMHQVSIASRHVSFGGRR